MPICTAHLLQGDNIRALEEHRDDRVGEASNPGPCLLRRYRRGMNPTRAVKISSEEPLVPVRNVVPRLVGLNLLPPAHRVWRRFLRVSQLWHWQVETCSHRPPSVCSTAWAHSCLIRSLSGHVWKSRPLGDGVRMWEHSTRRVGGCVGARSARSVWNPQFHRDP